MLNLRVVKCSLRSSPRSVNEYYMEGFNGDIVDLGTTHLPPKRMPRCIASAILGNVAKSRVSFDTIQPDCPSPFPIRNNSPHSKASIPGRPWANNTRTRSMSPTTQPNSHLLVSRQLFRQTTLFLGANSDVVYASMNAYITSFPGCHIITWIERPPISLS